MASHGKIPDLLDERYLDVHDVFGNVQPFPTLVPYEQYVQRMIVYRLNTNHEFYLPLLQDFTDRFVRSGQTENHEAWTWLVQWDVKQSTPDLPATHVAKKQRMDAHVDAAQKKAPAKPTKPYFTHIQRRLLHQELYQEEDIMRILIAIVQVDSKLVPNYIEFLYQWIDYYEGGGMALKAAVRREIPSLWLFEFHPRSLFRLSEEKEDDGLDKAAEEMGEKLNKRKKPLAISEMERLTEQSERLQYREVKFGIQQPINPDDEPLPPLINVPYEPKQRQQYYAACFKNRQRAFLLLQEAGMTARQIANYKKLQPMSPLETPEDVNGGGFLNYYKEEPSAHAVFLDQERFKQLREKQREAAMSRCLAEEARMAIGATYEDSTYEDSMDEDSVNGNSTDSSLPPPLILPKATGGSRHSESYAAWINKRNEANIRTQEIPIMFVPAPMAGKCKARAFAIATARPLDSDSSGSSDEEEEEDPDDIDPDELEEGATNMTATTIPTIAPMPGALPAQPLQPGPAFAPNIQAFIQSLSHAQLAHLLPTLQPQVRQAVMMQRGQQAMMGQPPPPPGFNPHPAFLHTMQGPGAMQGAMGRGVVQGPAVQGQGATGPGAMLGRGAGQGPGVMLGRGALPMLGRGAPQGRGAMLGRGAVQGPGAVSMGAFPMLGRGAPHGRGAMLGRGAAQGPGAMLGRGAMQVPVPMQERVATLPNLNPRIAMPINPPALTFGEIQAIAERGPPSSHDLHQSPADRLSSLPADTNQAPPIPIAPLQQLAGALTLNSPAPGVFRECPIQAASPDGVPVQIYLPKVVMAQNSNLESATDCMLLGYTRPETGEITLSKAIFLPTSIWENMLRRLQRGNAQVLETYGPPQNHPRFAASKGILRNPDEVKGPHRYVYTKVEQIFGLMTSCENREEELTKRWRTTPGPMTERRRGAIWEGWGLYVDRPVEMGYAERHGPECNVSRSMDGKRGFGLSESQWQERVRIRKEIDEMLEEECGSEEEDGTGGEDKTKE